MKLLIIEDDTDINNMIGETLKKAGYEYTQAYSGTEALLLLDTQEYALAIMDLMLPGIQGEELLPKLKEKQKIPVIVISAKDGLDSKVYLLESGADDYMTKPFEIEELLARIKVQLRKTGNKKEKQEILEYKDLTLHRASFQIFLEKEEILLTKQEFKILELLLMNPHRVFSKQEIYDYAWEDVYLGEDKTIHVHISNIRKKLKAITEEEYIETVWGIGFRLAK